MTMYAEPEMIAGRGQGILSGGPTLVQAPFISSAIQEIEFLTGLAHEANSSLYDIRQRVFGPWPQQSGGNSLNAKEPSAPCLEAQLSDALAKLRSVLSDTRDNAHSLSARL